MTPRKDEEFIIKMTNKRIIEEIYLMIENQLPELSIPEKIALAFEDWFLDIIIDME